MSRRSIIGVSVVMAGISAAALVLAVGSLPGSGPESAAAHAIDYPGFDVHDPPAAVPALTFNDVEGGEVALSSFEGRVVLVNLWATWCPPCVEEMPALDNLQAQLGGDDFEVVALSIDREGADVVLPFFETQGLEHLPVYLDPDAYGPRAFQARGFPTSILLDRQGRRVATYEGELAWDAPEVVDMLRRVVEN